MRISLDRVRHSFRTLSRNKRFSALAILSLAVAIALNTTMYSVLDAMIRPKLAMRSPERLYSLSYYGDYLRRIADQDKIDAMDGLRSFVGRARNIGSFGQSNIAERGSRNRDVRVLDISANYFALLGNRPSAGRLLSQADAYAQPRPVVLSERLWKQLFPERAFFDTATILLGAQPRLVLGLLPYEGDFPGQYTDVWELIAPSTRGAAAVGIWNVVRLRDGVSEAEAKGELAALAKRLSIQAHDELQGWFRMERAMGEPFRFQRFHLALIGAVVAVLLVACVNLANLQLARGITRSREFATRAAIGATRRDIIVQLMLETAWLALAGLVFGVFLTYWGMKLVTASMPPSLSEFLLRPQASWRVFAFAAVASLASLGLMGLLPAIRLSRVDIHELIKSGAGTGASRRTRRQYGALVVVQIGLALALLVGASLLIRTAASLYRFQLNPKFEKLIQGYVRVDPVGPSDRRARADISAQLISRARSVPTVIDAATYAWVQPRNHKITLDDPGGTPKEIGVGLFSYAFVSSTYVRTVGLEITKGRDFLEGEFAEQLVIVDQRTATYLWPRANPIGRLVKLSDARSDMPWLRVIGVVRFENYWSPVDRANQEGRQAPAMGAVYVLNGADRTALGPKGEWLRVAVRGSTDVFRLPVLLRNALTDPSLGSRAMWLEQLAHTLRIDEARTRQNFVTAMFVTFALLALAVAALGVYAIVSHSVSQRTREFGVRIALGADERDIRQKVLFEGNVLALSGIAVGLILAAQTVGLLRAFLRGEEDKYDSWLYAIVALLLFAITLLASYVPARRAMRINPVEALKND